MGEVEITLSSEHVNYYIKYVVRFPWYIDVGPLSVVHQDTKSMGTLLLSLDFVF